MHPFPLEEWLDCGTAQTIIATNHALLEAAGESYVHPTANVDTSTLQHAAVMEQCEISGSQLTDCIVLPGAKLQNCQIDHEIIAAGARINANKPAV